MMMIVMWERTWPIWAFNIVEKQQHKKEKPKNNDKLAVRWEMDFD